MEDVLEVYQRPYDGNEVLVCMDETSKQQVKETRVPRPAAPGLSAAYDYEYERNGVSSLFMLFAPLDGWRRVEVRERRTKVDWAHVIKKLVDEDYPDRDQVAHTYTRLPSRVRTAMGKPNPQYTIPEREPAVLRRQRLLDSLYENIDQELLDRD